MRDVKSEMLSERCDITDVKSEKSSLHLRLPAERPKFRSDISSATYINEIVEQNDCFKVVIPNQSPEIYDRITQRNLRQDVSVCRTVALKRRHLKLHVVHRQPSISSSKHIMR